jgi:phenylalanyl-tRNA synthetase alpha chain
MKQKIDTLLQETIERLAIIDSAKDVERLRIDVLGRKGTLSHLFKKLGESPAKERPVLGKILNETRLRLESAFEEAKSRTTSVSTNLTALDISLPGRLPYLGHLHPITRVSMEITEIFQRLGFEVVEGPDVELDYYNFEALNIPKDHPARDMQDTFYVTDFKCGLWKNNPHPCE